MARVIIGDDGSPEKRPKMKQAEMRRNEAKRSCRSDKFRQRGAHGSLARRPLRRHVIHVVDHGNKQVEEEFTAVFHFALHGAAALEGLAGADDESKVVRAELRVVVGRVGVGVTGGGEDGGALDARLQSLLPERKLLELVQAVFLGLAVDDGVLEDGTGGGIDNGLAGAVVVAAVLEGPGVALLVELETGVVVALVEVLEDGREDLWLLVGQVYALVGRVEELAAAGCLEPGRVGQDILVCSEEALLVSNGDGDDGAGEVLAGCMDGEEELWTWGETDLPMLGEGVAEGEVMWAMRSAVLDDGVLNEAFFMCWDIDLLVRCLETLSFLERLPPETDSFLDRLPAEMLSWRLRLENMVDVDVGVGVG
jgi:hypothetical protein